MLPKHSCCAIAMRLAQAVALAMSLLVAGSLQAQPDASSEPLAAPLLQDDTMNARWSAFRMADDGSSAETTAWELLRAARLETGLRDLPHHSLALLLDAADAFGRGDRPRAVQLLAWSQELSPSGSEQRFVEARARLQGGPLALPEALALAFEGWERRSTTLAGRRVIEVAAAAGVGGALALFAFAVTLVIGLRRIGQFAFDLRLALLRAPTLGQVHLLLGVGLCGLAMWTGSVGWLVAALVAVAAPYAGWQERIVLFAATAAMAGVPLAVNEAAIRWIADTSDAERAAYAPLRPCNEACTAALREQADGGNGPAWVALAWVTFRYGDAAGWSEAAALLEQAPAAVRSGPSAQCLSGALLYARGACDEAEQVWRAAFDGGTTADTRAAAAINLSRCRESQGDRLGVAQMLELAEQLSPGIAAQYRGYTGRSRNRVVAACAQEPDALWRETYARVTPEQARPISEHVAALWTGRVGIPGGMLVPAALAFWLLIAAPLGWAGWSNRRCAQCGTPTSRFVYRRAWESRQCIACHQVEAVGAQLTFAQRHARERRAQDRREQLRLWSAVLGALLPGGGLLARGHALAGALLLAGACVSAVAALLAPVLLRSPGWVVTPAGFDGVVTSALLVGCAVWLVSAAVELVVFWRSR